MATIDIGKLTFTHKGDYAGGTAYVLNDVVYYNGSAYIAKQSTTGNVPTNTTYWSTFSAGSGGIWNSGLSIGSAGQVVKVNSGASALEFGSAGKNIVMKTTQTEAQATADYSIVEADIVATKNNPFFNIAGIVSLNTRVAGSLDDENIQIDVDYSLDGGSSYTTLSNSSYGTDVFAPGQDDTHNNLYDVNTRSMGTRAQLTMNVGATVRFRLNLDYDTIQNGQTIYFNRGGSTSGQGASSITIYEE